MEIHVASIELPDFDHNGSNSDGQWSKTDCEKWLQAHGQNGLDRVNAHAESIISLCSKSKLAHPTLTPPDFDHNGSGSDGRWIRADYLKWLQEHGQNCDFTKNGLINAIISLCSKTKPTNSNSDAELTCPNEKDNRHGGDSSEDPQHPEESPNKGRANVRNDGRRLHYTNILSDNIGHVEDAIDGGDSAAKHPNVEPPPADPDLAPNPGSDEPSTCNLSVVNAMPRKEMESFLRMCIAIGTKFKTKEQTKKNRRFPDCSPGVHYYDPNQQLKLFCGHGTALDFLYRTPIDDCKQIDCVKSHVEGVEAWKQLAERIHAVIPNGISILNIRFVVSFVEGKEKGATLQTSHQDGGSDHGALLVMTGGDASADIIYSGVEKLTLQQPVSYTANARWHGRGNDKINHAVQLATTGRVRIAILVDLDTSPNMVEYNEKVKSYLPPLTEEDDEEEDDEEEDDDEEDDEEEANEWPDELLTKAKRVLCNTATNSNLSVKPKFDKTPGYEPLVRL